MDEHELDTDNDFDETITIYVNEHIIEQMNYMSYVSGYTECGVS